MRVYIAGPYSAACKADIGRNVARAMDAALELIRLGHTPFCPHLSHYLEERATLNTGTGVAYEEWLRQDREWLRFCDVLLLLAPSPGANNEVAVARAIGIPVVTSMSALDRPREA